MDFLERRFHPVGRVFEVHEWKWSDLTGAMTPLAIIVEKWQHIAVKSNGVVR